MEDKINILVELKEAGARILTTTDNKNYYSVPEDYFNNLADGMLTHVFINSLPSQNPYYLPSGYFENFPEILFEKLNIQKNIGALQKKVYAVPEGYFDNLADNILKKIKSLSVNPVQQELEELSPLLGKIAKTNVYSVPENYFNKLEPINKMQGDSLPAAKVISIGNRARKWVNYAAAACIATVLFGGGYLYFSGNKPPATQGSSSIPPIAKMDVQKEISSLSDDDINNYLKDNNNTAVYTNTNDADPQNLDVETLLQNVSDEEIQQYLNQHPEPDETGGGI